LKAPGRPEGPLEVTTASFFGNVRSSLESRESHIVAEKDPSLTLTRKGVLITVMQQMSTRPQQIIGDANSSNLSNTGDPISEGEDEGREILQWLSPLEPQKRHQDVRRDRLNSVGNWVLETSEFRKWRDREDGCVGEQVLFCYGNPGVGKTYVR